MLIYYSITKFSVAKPHLTKRAPDAGDSAHIPSSFLRLSFFLVGRLRRPHPSAGNACRWAVPFGRRQKTMKNTVIQKTILLIFFVITSVSACGRLDDFNFSSLPPTSTLIIPLTLTHAPTLAATLTFTVTPAPTFTPSQRLRIIPVDYYRILKTKFTSFKNGKAESICIQTNTHQFTKTINEEVIEITASSDYETVLGECFLPSSKQWTYQINVYTGEFVKTSQPGMDSSTAYYGKSFDNGNEDVFSLSGTPIPVWKRSVPVWKKDIFGQEVVLEGTRESLIDKKTGILVYEIQSLSYITDPSLTNVLETISLRTNALIGGILDSTEFTYSKE